MKKGIKKVVRGLETDINRKWNRHPGCLFRAKVVTRRHHSGVFECYMKGAYNDQLHWLVRGATRAEALVKSLLRLPDIPIAA
jgi:hypothetical protein